jgi:hypothetical protein
MKPLITILFFLLIGGTCAAQSLVRSSISSFGGSVQNEGIYLSQTGGQGSLHVQSKNEGVLLHQGFEQAFNLFASDNRFTAIQVRVYPNPNTGQFSIATDLGRDTAYELALYDAMGKLVHRDQFEAGILQQVTLSNEVSPGAYTLRIWTTKGYTGTTKLIIH